MYMHIHVNHCSIADYEALERDRLEAAQLEESQLLSLMMRCVGEGAEALRAPVYVQKIARYLGGVSFSVFYTDADLRPVPKGHASQLVDDYWAPNVPLPLNSSKMRAVAYTGFFVPYETDTDTELFAMTNELNLVGVRPIHITLL